MDAYNPGFANYNGTSDSHICRRDLLNALIEMLDASGPDIEKKHILIQSQSGMGKTSLIQQINRYGLIKHAPDLNWFPLVFPESHLEISQLSDIWRQGLSAMASYLRTYGYKHQAQSWNTVVNTYLRSIRCTHTDDTTNLKLGFAPPEKDNTALLLLLESIHQFPKTAVLLIDNIDDMLGRLNSGNADFFDTLQRESALRIVGTCSLSLQDSPLELYISHGLFNVIELERLNASESLTLLQDYADKRQRPDISCNLKQTNQKVRGLIELAGGNPRTLLLLFPLIERRYQDVPVHLLQGILDRITPWYKSRLRDLSNPAQQLFNLIAINRKPMALSRVYTELNESPDRCRTILNELLVLKHVETLNLGTCSEVSYQVTERFFNIWCLMRNRIRHQRPSEWLTYFLEVYYDPIDLEKLARNQLLIPPSDKPAMESGLALASAIHNKRLTQALQFSILIASTESDPSFEKAKAFMEDHCIDSKLGEAIERMQNFAKVRKLIDQTPAAAEISSDIFFNHLFGSPSLHDNEKTKLEGISHSIPPEHWRNLNRFLVHESEQWQNLLKHHSLILYQAISSGLMVSLDDIEGAEITNELWKDPVIPAISYDSWLDGPIRLSKDEIRNIESIYQLAIKFDQELPVLWRNLGSLQQRYFRRYQDAEFSLRHAINIDPAQALSWTYLGNLLKNLPGRLQDSENAYRQALEIEPSNPNSYNNLAWFLFRSRSKSDDALQLVHQALNIDPTHISSIHTLATILIRNNKWDQAAPYIRGLMRALGKNINQSAWYGIVTLINEIIRMGKIRETVSLLDEHSDSLHLKALRKILLRKKSDCNHNNERPFSKEYVN